MRRLTGDDTCLTEVRTLRVPSVASVLDTMATAASDEAAVGGIAARLKARKPVVVRPAAIESASSSDADDDDDEEFDTAPKRLPKTRSSNHASTVVQVQP